MQAKDLVGQNVHLTIYFWGGSMRVDGLVKLIEETDYVAVGPSFLEANSEIRATVPGCYGYHATTAQRQAEREEVAL